MAKTSTNNLMYATFLRSQGFELINCQIEWIPCVLFTLEGKRVKETRKRYHQMGVEELEQLNPHTGEILGINEANIREAYHRQMKLHESKIRQASKNRSL